jgi:predicted O-methyltransferase YrrM
MSINLENEGPANAPAMIRALLRRILNRLFAGLARKEDIEILYDQIAGLVQIQSALAGKPILKPLRGWALSPDAMAIILSDLQERDAPTVIEFGSGQSTVVIACYLKNKGAGRLISIEHDSAYAASIKTQLVACGVSEYVDVHILPLVECGNVGCLPSCQSYELAKLPDLAIDLAIIDGPPNWCGPSGRYHPLYWVLHRLSNGGTAYLDDTVRGEERRVVEEIVAQLPYFVSEELRAEKGLTKFTKGLNDRAKGLPS